MIRFITLPLGRAMRLCAPRERTAKEHDVAEEKKAGTPAKEGDDRKFKAGIAVGIGSAAIVAALLYARSGKPRKK
jgi:hypothetical protein